MSAEYGPNLTRRNVLAGVALLSASGIAYARTPVSNVPRFPKGKLDSLLPKTVGPWTFETASGLVLPPPDSLSERLYDDVITRVYAARNLPPIMMLIAYSNVQDGMLQVHRPETCYPVGGYTLSDSRIIDVPVAPSVTVPCRFFSAESAGRSEQVLYWTRIGRFMPGRWIEQRWAVVDANLRREIPDGILVRFSVPVASEAAALPALKQFAASLVTASPPPARKLLIGS